MEPQIRGDDCTISLVSRLIGQAALFPFSLVHSFIHSTYHGQGHCFQRAHILQRRLQPELRAEGIYIRRGAEEVTWGQWGEAGVGEE